MTTESRDPLMRGLDELAGLPDQEPVVDRMAGITAKARGNRRRKIAAGVAGAVVIAAGTVGAVQLLPDDQGQGGTPGIATEPPATTAPTGLEIELHLEPIGQHRFDVSYRIHGTASAWSADGGPTDYSGPRHTTVTVDGEETGLGTDGGDLNCRAGAPVVAFDETWKGVFEPLELPVGPGTYVVTVEAPYCGPDGQVVPNETSVSVVLD